MGRASKEQTATDKRMRLDKLLANMGYGTRSEIKKAVKQGKVTVDGRVVKDSGLQIKPNEQQVAFSGELVVYRDVVYLMLHKPPGVVSATEDSRDETVIDLLDADDRILQPFPVGRLDKDTEGLLLLTNDGQLAHDLLSPRKHVPKTYFARVLGEEPVGQADRERFAAGVELDDGYVTMPAELEVEQAEQSDDGWVSLIRITIQEGKFHQIKRMFQAVGKQVIYLKRLSMGPLHLDETLPIGAYRELTEDEIELLRSHRNG
ncbi:pseudouridine synthase [Paenibacillus curdlanolyticus YK9]|uniref:Pseudouridine synthase n=1 Tax=Paenibacillus curdlanolyticus YK9 TaxID=717606 RepID=E0I315_9BACL|nr:pseudouridine synthase [Paenibacillus curdlanolyticus]EFM12679.1 pseudouridine synthase [Paenibacillus curdlanolyticus YK9]